MKGDRGAPYRRPEGTVTAAAREPANACASDNVSKKYGANARSARLAPSFRRMNALVV